MEEKEKCIRCGSENLFPESLYQCRRCGKFSEYGITEIEFKRQTPIKEEICPFCGSEDLLEEDWYKCGDCGKEFSEEAVIERP
jgi:hypothetical protein